jgi:hypothetical protein
MLVATIKPFFEGNKIKAAKLKENISEKNRNNQIHFSLLNHQKFTKRKKNLPKKDLKKEKNN